VQETGLMRQVALISIVIPTCNERDRTRLCLESILATSHSPLELLLIDNASTDDTPSLLDEFRHRPGPVRVEIIRNDTNLGFAKACNQGLARAQGNYVVFLNNDTVVTDGWLDQLIAWALHDFPTVGLVGPVTNYAAPPQQIPVPYTDLPGMHAFAAQRRQDFAHQAMEFPRLSGLCLLARRDVLDKVGGFDERFGIGFFEDDDLCFRVQDQGYRCLIALDVFIHHFGSQTFKGLSIDTRHQLETNFALFKEKWGAERTRGYHLPPDPTAGLQKPPPSAPPHASPLSAAPYTGRVSLCMIVRNEEANLPACLQSAADLVQETVIVDTGSTDATKDIAQRFHAKVHDFPWIDSFAAARNESIRHATGDWIFWLDADDRLDEENRGRLRTLFSGLRDENVAYDMKCLCLPDPVSKTATVVDHIRLFRNHPDLRWKYRVHEQILPAIRRLKGEIRWSDVVIHHVGYQDPVFRRKKLVDRDLRLLELENAEQPDEPFVLFNLGSVYQELGRMNESLPLLRRSLELSHPTDSIVRKLYAMLVQAHRNMGHRIEALALCRLGRSYYPDDTELLFHEGMILREQRDLAGAEACMLQLLQSRPADHFASIDTGLRGYKARNNLAIIYRDQRRFGEAEAQWRTALEEKPDFPPAVLGIGELCLGQGRWDELEAAARRLEGDAGGSMEASVLRARGHLARQEFPVAMQLLHDIITAYPQAVWPRVILSHCLLQEGRDWAAAEQALRDVLALDPHNAEAKSNLAVLLRQQGREDAGHGRSGRV
jgi:GT2 family glycosyltransferase/tetratricopeptide (TPR) repeat protein